METEPLQTKFKLIVLEPLQAAAENTKSVVITISPPPYAYRL